MKTTFEINEVFSNEELKSIAKEVVKEEISNYFRNKSNSMRDEENTQRLILNTAYQFIFEEIHKIIPDYEKKIAEGVKNAIDKERFYSIFRPKDFWYEEEGLGYTIMKRTINEKEKEIVSNIKNAIENFDYKEFSREKIAECADKISSSFYDFCNILRKEE